MSTAEPASPFEELDWLQRERERRWQLEIPGADPHRGRREIGLLAQQQAVVLLRRTTDLALEREELRLERERLEVKSERLAVKRKKRIERQEKALGWIQVVAIALLIPALVVSIALAALGEADPWVLAPLLAAACGGAALPVIKPRIGAAPTEDA